MKKEKGNKKKLSAGEFVLLTVNFLWMAALYFGGIYVAENVQLVIIYQILTAVYVTAAIILVGVSVILSGKVVTKGGTGESTPAQIVLSRKVLLWAIPLIAVLVIDFIDLFVVEYVKQVLSTVLSAI